MRLKDKQKRAFDKYAPSTRRVYAKWINDLIKYHYRQYSQWIEPEQMTQHHINEFLAWMVRPMEYSRHSTNQAKLAIRAYFDYIGNPMTVQLVSAQYNLVIPDVLSSHEFACLLNNLDGIYRMAADDIYNLIPADIVLQKYKTGHGSIRRQTLNKKLRESAETAGIVKSVNITIIRNSGLIEYLRKTNDIDGAIEKTGLSHSTVSRYWKIARLKE